MANNIVNSPPLSHSSSPSFYAVYAFYAKYRKKNSIEN